MGCKTCTVYLCDDYHISFHEALIDGLLTVNPRMGRDLATCIDPCPRENGIKITKWDNLYHLCHICMQQIYCMVPCNIL